MTEFFTTTLGAGLFAVFCWWLGTGAILWLVRLPTSTFRWSMFCLSFLLGLSLWTASLSMRSHSVLNAYIGFVSVIAMWSWHEMAFLTGWLAGPRRLPLDPGLGLNQRFGQSVMALLYHEVALLFNFGVLLALQQGQPNHVALCTYALLWCMRLSAKLNLFFGVPQVGEQYLPVHLRYIGSYFKSGRISPFFFFTMALSVVVWSWMVWEVHTGAVMISAAWVLLSSLLGLAIIEHLLMVFALPLQRLWGWAMKRSPYAATRTSLLETTPAVIVPVNTANQADPA
ncbi:MAG: putative photosynthetic complex assembly protein PuhE [Burkholderiales bacterium]